MKKISKENLLMIKKITYILFAVIMAMFSVEVHAATIGDLAENVTSIMSDIAQLITSVSYVAGIGFAMGAILKFKQHKDNPTQMPIGTPIAMLGVAAALLFLPTVLQTAGESIFGSGATAGGVEGVADITGG